jgi:hypothetical protein
LWTSSRHPPYRVVMVSCCSPSLLRRPERTLLPASTLTRCIPSWSLLTPVPVQSSAQTKTHWHSPGELIQILQYFSAFGRLRHGASFETRVGASGCGFHENGNWYSYLFFLALNSIGSPSSHTPASPELIIDCQCREVGPVDKGAPEIQCVTVDSWR